MWNKIRSLICRRHISYAKRISYCKAIFHFNEVVISFKTLYVLLGRWRHIKLSFIIYHLNCISSFTASGLPIHSSLLLLHLNYVSSLFRSEANTSIRQSSVVIRHLNCAKQFINPQLFIIHLNRISSFNLVLYV